MYPEFVFILPLWFGGGLRLDPRLLGDLTPRWGGGHPGKGGGINDAQVGGVVTPMREGGQYLEEKNYQAIFHCQIIKSKTWDK